MLRQPTEKRRNAATKVKSSTWCDNTVAPILERRWSETRNPKSIESRIQAFKDPECTEAKLRTKDGEEAVEEGHGPFDLGQDQEDDLKDDEEAIDHSPKHASWLVWYCTIPIVP